MKSRSDAWSNWLTAFADLESWAHERREGGGGEGKGKGEITLHGGSEDGHVMAHFIPMEMLWLWMFLHT